MRSTIKTLPPPTRARHWVIVFAVTLAILAYIDRVCIQRAAPLMSADLGFSKTQMGAIFSAFALSYAVFEIPGGWLGDWMGPRKVLMRIVVWWSAFTALTGAARGFSTLWAIRFLFGAGEAGCFPNLTKAFTIWLPAGERVRAQAFMWTFARWGGAFTPPLVGLVLGMMGWRMAFVLFGALGLLWAVPFYIWFRDNPKDHKSVNEGELALLKGSEEMAGSHGDVPWGVFLRSQTVWMLWVQYFLLSFPWYFYITWLFTYLKEGRNLSDTTAQTYAILPLLLGGCGSLACGILSPLMNRWTGSVRKARRMIACLGFLGAAVMMVASINTEHALLGVFLMGMASFFNDLVMPGAWGACMDVGGKYAGTLSGSMNMMGNLAGAVAPLLAGYVFDVTNNNFNVFLYIMAGAYLLGSIVWPFIDPVTPLDGSASEQH